MEEKEKIIRSFREVHLRMSRFFNQLLGEIDLTFPQYVLLNHLSASGEMTMTEASEKLYISKPAVTNLVDRLAKGKFLVRKAHPSDRRAYHLQILPKGEGVVKKIQKRIIFDVMMKTFDDVGEEERKGVQKFLDSFLQHADEVLADSKAN